VSLRQRKKERTRQLIAEAAFHLFTTQGYERTTMEEIAAMAQVGTRTLYRYYPTKEHLLLGTTRPGLRMLVQGLVERPPEEPLADSLREALAKFCYILTMERERGVAMRELIEKTPSVRAKVYDEIGRTRADLATEIRKRLGASPNDLRPELAAGMVMVVVDTVVITWAGGRPDPRQAVEQAIELLSAGLVPVPAPLPRDHRRSAGA
jgi:AcrR family transcriptional regulator